MKDEEDELGEKVYLWRLGDNLRDSLCDSLNCCLPDNLFSRVKMQCSVHPGLCDSLDGRNRHGR
jgi:hypothetical protein